MPDSLLKQLGHVNPQTKIRHDHYVPFLILNGLERGQVDGLIKSITKKSQLVPVQKVDKFAGWSVPEQVKSKIKLLCKRLQTMGGPQVDAETGNMEKQPIKLYWERDEYQFVVEESDLQWPHLVEHLKLELVRNRYPNVPGYDMKNMRDLVEYEAVNDINTSKNPKFANTDPEKPWVVRKVKNWKIRNLVPAKGKVSHYQSLNGKRYPVMERVTE